MTDKTGRSGRATAVAIGLPFIIFSIFSYLFISDLFALHVFATMIFGVLAAFWGTRTFRELDRWTGPKPVKAVSRKGDDPS